jgi:hypothetical protein
MEETCSFEISQFTEAQTYTRGRKAQIVRLLWDNYPLVLYVAYPTSTLSVFRKVIKEDLPTHAAADLVFITFSCWRGD